MKSPYLCNPNILAHPDRLVQSVALDMTAQDCYLAGSPISAEGKLANDATAIGILLYDVHKQIGGTTGVVVISGRIQQDVAAEHSGVTISADCKAALIDVTFTGDGCRMGGGGLTELPEGYPYKEMGKKVVIAERTLDVTTDDGSGMYSNSDLTINIIDGADYEVLWNGDTYECKAFSAAVNGTVFLCIGNASFLGHEGGRGEPFIIMSMGGMSMVYSQTSGMHTFGLAHVDEIIHTMAPEFLPAWGSGLLMVNYDGETLSHSFDEILSHIQKGGFAYLVLGGAFYIPFQGGANNSISFSGHNPMDNKQYYIFTVAKVNGETKVYQQVGTFAMDKDFAMA